VNNLVFVGVVPHSALLIPLLSGSESTKALQSRAAMETLGGLMEAARPDTIVILETHSMLVDGAITLLDSTEVHGGLGVMFPAAPEQISRHGFTLSFDVDREFNAGIVAAAASSGVPVERVGHYRDSTPLKIEWGSLIPLWFLGATVTSAPKLVVGCTSWRSQLPPAVYVDFGRALRAAIAGTERRIAVIISTDLAHAHAADSHYGFDPAAAESDAAMVDAVRAGALDRLLGYDDNWVVDRAKNEGTRPLLALHGLLEDTGWQADVLSYEVPTYYGMMCAAYSSRKRGM